MGFRPPLTLEFSTVAFGFILWLLSAALSSCYTPMTAVVYGFTAEKQTELQPPCFFKKA